MNGFVATPAPETAPEPISLGSFWPALDASDFREAMRVGSTMVPPPRIRSALLAGALAADGELALWRAAQAEAGHASLAAVPAEEMDGQSRLVLLWRRAVYSFAAADLLETHRDLTVSDMGSQRATLHGESADDHKRNATRAIRALLGQSGTAVELI